MNRAGAAVLCAMLSCDGPAATPEVDWNEALPYWDPCGQFRSKDECPIGCEWLYEGNSDEYTDLGCFLDVNVPYCTEDVDCNAEQSCREFQIAECIDFPCDQYYSRRFFCWPHEATM